MPMGYLISGCVADIRKAMLAFPGSTAIPRQPNGHSELFVLMTTNGPGLSLPEIFDGIPGTWLATLARNLESAMFACDDAEFRDSLIAIAATAVLAVNDLDTSPLPDLYPTTAED